MTPGQADGADVKRFLSDLVVRLNVAPSTQKQALNALVFFLQKSLKIELVVVGVTKTEPLRELVWEPRKDPDYERKEIHHRAEDPHIA